MHIHILGICGTFMGGVAVLAQQMGHTVTGSDVNVYPPMSDTLRQAGITIHEGFDPQQFAPKPDMVVIGNALSRGNPAVEYVLNNDLTYTSGPQWLAEFVLKRRQVLALSGTHGKTTTSSLLTWILTEAGFEPGYLIGGVAQDFSQTAALGTGQHFVIEADEYDSAFFDKRSKFIHYHPRILVINNLEYDHADIFPDLAAIQMQFQYLLRTVPGCGAVIFPHQDHTVSEVLQRGCWSSQISFGAQDATWHAREVADDGQHFELWHRDQKVGVIDWKMVGQHNVHNALAATAAAHEVGVNIEVIVRGLKSFSGVKRRLEVRGQVKGVTVYDDFAHHPTAIATTLSGLRAKVGSQRILAVIEFASNTMKMGVHHRQLAQALRAADQVWMLQPEGSAWNAAVVSDELGSRATVCRGVTDVLQRLTKQLRAEDHVLIMSNKGFDGIHQRLLDRLQVQRV